MHVTGWLSLWKVGSDWPVSLYICLYHICQASLPPSLPPGCPWRCPGAPWWSYWCPMFWSARGVRGLLCPETLKQSVQKKQCPQWNVFQLFDQLPLDYCHPCNIYIEKGKIKCFSILSWIGLNSLDIFFKICPRFFPKGQAKVKLLFQIQ